MKAETEKGFLEAVRELAKLHGWKDSHSYLSIKSPAGFPDLVLCRPPTVIFAELKTQKGRVSPAQDAWLQALARCPGVSVFVWRPSDWDDIVKILSR